MKKHLPLLTLLFIFSFASGCALNTTPTVYYNPNYSVEQQEFFFQRDKQYCSDLANTQTPQTPLMPIPNQSPEFSSGNMTLMDNRGNVAFGSYHTTSMQNNSQSNAANFYNTGMAIQNYSNNYSARRNCLRMLGWQEVTVE